jgi:hypothetical protein
MNRAGACQAVLLCWLVTVGPATVAADRCEACHGDPGLYATDRRLYDYYRDWLTSPHKHAGVACADCHGGDPSGASKDAAHAGRLPVDGPSSSAFLKRQPEVCGRCHQEVAAQFTGSRHCSKVLRDERAPTCTTCHRAMNRKPYFRQILRQGCVTCHSSARGSPRVEVIDQAAEILHRMNVARFLLGWTALHFNRAGWPGDSRRQVETWRQAYHDALARVHGLDLLAVDQASLELLSALKRAFDEQGVWPPARPGGG